MKTADVNLETLISNAAKIIAPLWPLQTFIARNPFLNAETLKFEEALALGEGFWEDDCGLMDKSTQEVNRHMIKWCQAFLDEAQASLKMPEREKGFYRAWSLLAPYDSYLQSSDKNEWLSSLPNNAEEAIWKCLQKLNIPKDQIEEYFQHALAQLPGWAGYIKWKSDWQSKAPVDNNPITLTDFLAVRLVITCALDKGSKKETKQTRTRCKETMSTLLKDVKQREEKYLQTLLQQLAPSVLKLKNTTPCEARADAQIVFCIDVRSEPFRWSLEEKGNYETFGFAGFFGLPVSVKHFHTSHEKECCPALIKPRHKVIFKPLEEHSHQVSRHQIGTRLLESLHRFYQELKYNFATPFALVETLGIWCGLWMAWRTLIPLSSSRFKQTLMQKVKPAIPTQLNIEIPLAEQIQYADTTLRMMGLTRNFSRLVVLCGHGSSVENTPYASALDCGACGGNHGGPNSQTLAKILNSEDVRAALSDRGICIPPDTLFIGAEHNTTTDDITLADFPISDMAHKDIIAQLKSDFIQAGLSNSKYRCQNMGLDTSPAKAKIHTLKRSADWSEVRPEWGLARHAAFIIAPRSLTKDSHLDGRCFLHSYNWKEDADGRLLETVLCGPMVVGHWINAQYLFSTLNNSVYGSGSKITHNITGKFGIMQGNSSDLMQGLALQSVNAAEDHTYHEAMRLQVIIYAPRSTIYAIMERQPKVKNLVVNDWIVLVAIDPEDGQCYRLDNLNNETNYEFLNNTTDL